MQETRRFARISCCVDLESPAAERARYAVRMLLLPFRVDPEFVSRTDLGEYGLYYGSRRASGLPRSVVTIEASQGTWKFFEQREHAWPPNVHFAKMGGERIPAPFSAGGIFDFDPIASTFYFLSGWQEIVLKKRDHHGRFPYTESFQHRFGTVEIPVVEYYREKVVSEFSKRGMSLERKTWDGRQWAFCSTHDIDYLAKWRMGIVFREVVERALLNREGESPAQRLGRIAGATRGIFSNRDPYRQAIFRIIDEICARAGRGTYFIKAGETAEEDVGYSLASPTARRMFEALGQAEFEVGLHPSYHAYLHPDHFENELLALQSAWSRNIRSVRMHYLRYHHPESLRMMATSQLADLDVGAIDSTLGFARMVGFRHGTCFPFLLYDPIADEETGIWEMPLACMESALYNRMNLTPEEADKTTGWLLDVVRRFGGVFVGLWHNVLWDEQDAPGWGAHFLKSLEKADQNGALVDTLGATLDGWR